jgi:hypothetical protein
MATAERDQNSKQRIRETLLRFHPDKFHVRLLPRVQDGEERETVKEGVGRVVLALNELMVGEGM